MEICTWDWGAITTLMAAGVALWISHQWANQKGKEFVATEAKLLIKAINDLMSDEHDIHKLLENVRYLQETDKDIERSLKRFSSDSQKLWKDMQFFEDCLNHNKIISNYPFSKEVLPIVRLCNSFSSTYEDRNRLIANHVYKEPGENDISYFHSIESISSELDFHLHRLKNHLLPFATYKFPQRKKYKICQRNNTDIL